MTTGSRIIFVRFERGERTRFDAWKSHAASVVGVATGSPLTPASESARTVWHLASANHRMLARSSEVFPDIDDAMDAAQRAIEASADIDLKFVADQSRGRYGWYASAQGVPLVTCARWYGTERDRRKASELAVASLPSAVLQSVAREMRHSGSKSVR